jgi:hypothetical protein
MSAPSLIILFVGVFLGIDFYAGSYNSFSNDVDDTQKILIMYCILLLLLLSYINTCNRRIH